MATRYAKFAWALLLYTLPVIVYGAFVRASLSGDGCGAHWPDCYGQLLPTGGELKRYIEYIHRFSSGLYGLLALTVWIGAFRVFPKGHVVRKAASFTMFFTVVEALLGAVLVKKGWVATDDSVGRAVAMSVHLANTFLLLASAALTALWASGVPRMRFRGQGPVGWALVIGLVGLLVLGISGAVTALGDTIFPAAGSHLDTVTMAMSPTAHFLVRLRVLHPLIAMSVGVYMVLLAGLVSHLRPSQAVKRASQWVTGVFLFELALGLLNLAMKAPIAMQLVHLFVADVLWICLIVLGAHALAEGVPQAETPTSAPSEPVREKRPMGEVVKEYLILTKPRVISLLLFTTLMAMFVAAKGWPGFGLFMAVAIGGYMSAGAANAINMVIDRDIDGSMKRTSKRPTVTQNISSSNALLFGFGTAAASFFILWLGANLLTAMLALAGLAFYVVVYTLMLKRRTWHNIVIGGAAGAFPPLVGWASVTNDLAPMAWILFGLIFMWTPVHFWALAILIKEDYAKAGIPMLPVVHGERATVIQIGLYAVLTAILSILPVLQPHVGWMYTGVAIFMNLVLFARCLGLYRNTDKPRAVSLYKFTMVYLAVLFLMLAVDRATTM